MQAAQATLRQRSIASLSVSNLADASRTGYAEAKVRPSPAIIRVPDASRTGYAEAKFMNWSITGDLAGCKPHRLR